MGTFAKLREAKDQLNKIGRSLGLRRRRKRGEFGHGYIATKLRALLLENGFIVDNFWQQQGGYRRAEWDLARWGASGTWSSVGKGTATVSISSWDKMGNCVKYGIFPLEKDCYGMIDVSAKGPVKKSLTAKK